ncbi:NAD(P)-binding domain-containing protein [Streptomyces sp. NPDC059378]|uniref:NAD(P)-binding domain-containing protein n=1 Tax=Streptomyces sp. NPDC059378 TaxID=3346815 RepID=UPI0036924944
MAATATSSAPPAAAPDVTGQVVGILGGTGPQGRGPAYRLARAGKQVVIGSRSAERAGRAAAELGLPQDLGNAETARAGDIVIVAVPWEGHGAVQKEQRDDLAGNLVIDSVDPLGFDAQGDYALRPEEGSAAEQAAAPLTESRAHAGLRVTDVREIRTTVGSARWAVSPPTPGLRQLRDPLRSEAVTWPRHRERGADPGSGAMAGVAGASWPWSLRWPGRARRQRRRRCGRR